MAKTIEEINEKIKQGKAVVVTAEFKVKKDPECEHCGQLARKE